MPIIAIANQKGGVGKTTLTHNLGALLSRRGRRVLAVDLDFQTNLTQVMNVSPAEQATVFEILTSKPPAVPQDALVRAWVQDGGEGVFDLIPGSPLMGTLDQTLAGQPQIDSRLTRALAPLVPRYDYVLVDCPPLMALATLNAIMAADYVLIPVVPDYLPIRSTVDFFRNVAEIITTYRPELRVLGIAPQNCEMRTTQHRGAIDYLREIAAEWRVEVLPHVDHTTKVREAANAHLPVCEYDRSTDAALALEALTERIDSLCASRAQVA